MKSVHRFIIVGITFGFVAFLISSSNARLSDVIAIIALGLLVLVGTRMVAWVKKHGAKPKGQLQSRPRNAAEQTQNWHIYRNRVCPLSVGFAFMVASVYVGAFNPGAILTFVTISCLIQQVGILVLKLK